MIKNILKPALTLLVILYLTGLAAAVDFTRTGIADDPCGKESLFGSVIKKDSPCAGAEKKKDTIEKKLDAEESRNAKSQNEASEKKDTADEKIKREESKKEDGGRAENTEHGLFGMFVHKDPDTKLSFALRPFGEGIFAGNEASADNLPAGPDYPVGYGDEIGVTFWGRVTGEYVLTVTREGTLSLPMIGPMVVNGLTFGEVKDLITRKARSIVGAEVSVTMGRLRGIQVFVLGEVTRPGAYKISAVSTVTNALMAAGGAASIGSLRNVELRRSGEKPRSIDFYDLLLKGDKSEDSRLRNGDVVFVPVIGPVVGLSGNIKRPAVYEMKGRTSLQEALELAGGIVPKAYTQQVQVERIDGNDKRIVIDINAGDAEKAKSFTLSDGDLIKVSEVTGADTNAVYLYGNVKRPGKYELKPGMRLKDIITGYPDLLKETHLDYGLVKRLTPDLKTMVIPFNPGALLKGNEAENITLLPLDSIYLFSSWLFRERPVATIEGEVRKPGPVAIEENTTVKDLVLLAGGLTVNASHGGYELYRKDRLTQEVMLLRRDLRDAMTGEAKDNPVLEDGDIVRVHSALESDPSQTVIVYGQVNRPGQYPYAANMKVSDLVFAGGGATVSAYLKEVELASYEIEDGKTSKMSYRTIDLEKALAGDTSQNVVIRPYDTLYVREMTDWGRQQLVELNGEVRFPGKYIIKKGEKLSSVIKRAGGFTNEAYLKGAVFTRESVRELQQRSLEEVVKRLEIRLLTEASGQATSATSAGEPKQIEAAIQLRQELLNKLKSARAQGRISMDIEEHEKLSGSSHDIALEDGDRLHVPATPTQVQVMGSVLNPAAFIYDEDYRISEYIGKAGGLSGEADKSRIFVIKSDGTAFSRETSSWGLSFMSSRLDPGDTIVVPEKLDKGLWLKEVKDLTQILYQIAVTAGVLIVAF